MSGTLSKVRPPDSKNCRSWKPWSGKIRCSVLTTCGVRSIPFTIITTTSPPLPHSPSSDLAIEADLTMWVHGSEVIPLDPKTNLNKMAERTLLRLKQKLNGQEENAHLSISGQVNYLIQKASDPRNLCKLFAGWQAYL
ncbi:hypothetical protein Btru_075317 [Bulinus truncatus]|nr:hypothetical protein Btru_075317 [Bulinus truncatus]